MNRKIQTIETENYLPCGCGMPRRQFLKGAGALAAGVMLSSVGLEAQAGPPKQGRVDVHYHYAPPQWAAAVTTKINQGVKMNDPLHAFKDWTPARAVEMMDQAGVATSMVSITTPGIWFGEKNSTIDETRQLARDCNEFAAKMRADYKGRFGQLAVLPLPDVEGSLREVEYALDTLQADGFGVLTNYGEIYGDRLLGDPAFAPVFQELNRRKAVVFVHRRIYDGPDEVFGWDHYRTMLSLINNASDLMIRVPRSTPSALYPDVHFIISHGGGLMPFVVERSRAPEGSESKEEMAMLNATLAAMRQFHYDTAHANNTYMMSALKKVVPVSQIMFGTDFPLTNVAAELKGLETSAEAMSATELRLIERDNALGLFPRYKT